MVERQMAEFVTGLPGKFRAGQVIAREGSPADTIVSVADEVGADLIVIGAHGHSGVGRLLLGSVTETVLASSTCDVLTVRGW